MDQDCANNACKTKLREFRENNGKLYDEIYSLEDDIKEKDAFAERVVRQRNYYKIEVGVFNKKVNELQNENESLIEKVKQLEEDTDAGVQMLRMSHARENKLKNNLAEVEKS